MNSAADTVFSTPPCSLPKVVSNMIDKAKR